jgi:hypothetical protein
VASRGSRFQKVPHLHAESSELEGFDSNGTKWPRHDAAMIFPRGKAAMKPNYYELMMR